MATEHTPGPWRIAYNTDDYDGATPEDIANRYAVYIEGADGGLVYYTESGYFRGRPADVALIAAAPDLLAACEAALDFIFEEEDTPARLLRKTLDAAIAKAMGYA